MKIKVGFDIAFDAPQPTPMVILRTSTRPDSPTYLPRIKSPRVL